MNLSKTLDDLKAVSRLMSKDTDRWETRISNMKEHQQATLLAREGCSQPPRPSRAGEETGVATPHPARPSPPRPFLRVVGEEE